jgi:hypothetical protein
MFMAILKSNQAIRNIDDIPRSIRTVFGTGLGAAFPTEFTNSNSPHRGTKIAAGAVIGGGLAFGTSAATFERAMSKLEKYFG